MKLWTAIVASGINPVDHQTVKMDIAIERVSPALHKRNGATPRGANTKQLLSAPPQFAKQSADENVQDIADEVRVVGHAVAQSEGQR